LHVNLALPIPMKSEPPSASSLFSENTWLTLARRLHLSPRERQLVRAVFDEETEQAIALTLGISVRTVHTHFERLYHKLGVKTRVGLVVRVFQEFLVLSNTATPTPQHRDETAE